MHRYCKVHTKLGGFWMACSPRGITAIRPATETPSLFEAVYRKRFGESPRTGNIPGEYKQALRQAAQGQKTQAVSIDWSGFTEFQRKVLKTLLKVPPGKVKSYSWLARQAGFPKAARAVGNAMANNPVPFIIPCHRIVPASGGVGNYGLGKDMKRELLIKEGADIQ